MMKRLSLLLAGGFIATMLAAGLWSPVARAAPSLIPSILSQQSVSTCAYDNMGWIICPVLRATAQAGDYAFTFVSQNFLQIELSSYDAQSGAAQAGAIMRTFANVLFVIAFLYIVYALMTGRGIGNYNLKRLVPRFILAVIFVNVSYYICSFMVDVSNILGVGIQDLLVNRVAKTIGPSAMPLASSIGSYDAHSLTDITSGVIQIPGVAWVLLAPLSAVVMSSAIICSILIIVLIIRKTLVVALIFFAPIAFLAYLLPNTSDYFSKWLKLFIHLLLLFPVISLLIGAGQIVSASIVRAGGADYRVNGDTILINYSPVPKSATLYLVAAGAAVLPLAGSWYAFKAATSAIDAAGARVSRDGLRRSSRERDEKVKKREQTTMDMNKKSMMLRGINRLQQLNVAKNGESTTTLFGRMGGAYRGRNKHQAKTPEQARFDTQVQQRLTELRGGSEGARTPQEVYSQALQRYQEHMSGEATGDGVNINSYEGIDLKASEAFLLESLGKGVGVAPGDVTGANLQETQPPAPAKSAQIKPDSSKSNTAPTPSESNTTADSFDMQRAPALQAAANHIAAPSATDTNAQAGATANSSVPTAILVQPQAKTSTEGDAADMANATGFAARRPVQNSNEQLAKARAAKYVAAAQDELTHDGSQLATDELPNTPDDNQNDLRLR